MTNQKKDFPEKYYKEYTEFRVLLDKHSTAYVGGRIAESLKLGHEAWDFITRLLEAERKEYDELILAVGNKHKGETRHQTALRYIQDAEKSSGEAEEIKNGK